MDRKTTGAIGEAIAREYLKKHGYAIISTNVRCRRGEIDIIARHKKSLVFVEVRTKRSREFGLPEESVTTAKARQLRANAYYYLNTLAMPPDSWRIDFVAVELDGRNKPARIELFAGAIGDED